MPGTLTLRPLSAKLTRNTELFGTMDPYCKVVLGKQKVQSEVCENGGKNPHWEGSLLVLKRNTEPFIDMEIKEKDWLLPDGTIGTCRINLNEVENEKRVLKWYPVLFKDKPAGKILVEASYQSENGMSKNPQVPEPYRAPEQIQPIPVQPQIAQGVPVQHDFRQPVHTQEQQFQGGQIHGFNPMNQAPHVPQNTYNQPEYQQPADSYNGQQSIYAPPAHLVEEDRNQTQKYPTFESQQYQHGYENQDYGYQQNPEAYNNDNQNNYPYNHDSRPVTDFPHPGTLNQPEKRNYNGRDIIRGTR